MTEKWREKKKGEKARGEGRKGEREVEKETGGRKEALHHAALDQPLSAMVRLDQLSPSHRLRMNDGRPETVRRTVTAAHADQPSRTMTAAVRSTSMHYASTFRSSAGNRSSPQQCPTVGVDSRFLLAAREIASWHRTCNF